MIPANRSRRQFLRETGTTFLAGWAVASGLVNLAGCGGGEEEATAGKPDAANGAAKNAVDAAREAADPCSDVSGLTEAELATRTTFEYEKEASDPEKPCDTCNFWIPPEGDSPCGGCTLVKGPIHPLGSCMSWAAKIET